MTLWRPPLQEPLYRVRRHRFPAAGLHDRQEPSGMQAVWQPGARSGAATGHGPHDIERPPTQGYTEQETA